MVFYVVWQSHFHASPFLHIRHPCPCVFPCKGNANVYDVGCISLLDDGVMLLLLYLTRRLRHAFGQLFFLLDAFACKHNSVGIWIEIVIRIMRTFSRHYTGAKHLHLHFNIFLVYHRTLPASMYQTMNMRQYRQTPSANLEGTALRCATIRTRPLFFIWHGF